MNDREGRRERERESQVNDDDKLASWFYSRSTVLQLVVLDMTLNYIWWFAQLAGTVQYSNCISDEG